MSGGRLTVEASQNLKNELLFSAPRRSTSMRCGTVTRTEFGRAQSGSPSLASGRGGSSPHLERFVSQDAERAAGGEMALDVEGVLDSGVNGQEALG